MTMNIRWRTRELERHAERAARDSIDETMAEAVNVAKPLAPVRTGILQGSIRFNPARREGNQIVGRWGSFDVNYAIYQEIGTIYIPGSFFLARGSQVAYPKLPGRIRDRMRRVA